MIEQYKNWLIIQGNTKSEATINNYISRIKNLLSILKVEEINQDSINKYLLDKKQTYSISTYNGHLASLRTFFKFLKLDIDLPTQTKPDNILHESIDEKFLENEIIPIVDCEFIYGDRLKAVLYFMFFTGVRASEIGKLKREDIDLENRIAKIHGKGKKERLVIFTEKVKGILYRYFQIEAENINAFNTSKARLGKIFQKINTYFKDIRIYPHLLRHSFATMYLEKTNDIATLSKLLGHEDIKTTMRYLNMKIDKIKELYDKKIK